MVQNARWHGTEGFSKGIINDYSKVDLMEFLGSCKKIIVDLLTKICGFAKIPSFFDYQDA